MSWKRTFFLFLIFISIVLFYYYRADRSTVLSKPSLLSPDSAGPQKPILELNLAEEIHQLSFNLSEPKSGLNPSAERKENENPERVVLEYEGEKKWRIVHPVSAPAEAVVADGLTSVLRLMPRVRELSFQSSSARDYGLDRPRQKICVEYGQKERCLLIGSQGAILKGIYAKWEHEDQFFLASSELFNAFDRTLYSLRAKQVLSFEANEIRSLQVRRAERELLLLHEGNHWILKKPDSSIIGPETVQVVFSKLTHLYAKDFVDGVTSKDPKLGFQTPSCVIRLSFSDGSRQTLVRGSEASGLDAYYVENSERGAVFLVSIGKFSELERALEAIHPF